MPDRVRTDFEASRGFPLDRFQQRALDALDAGTNVLVAAPTGSGKTVIAEYAIARALADGGKGFYTTPLKALSNQKYGDLVEAHGGAAVGLLTGDNSVHGDARVVVMTTEVLRNMIYAASPALDGLQVVVLDEVHYLQDRYRGPVWEEVIVHLAAPVRLVCLSATVSNAEEVAAWIETVRGPTTAIIEEERPVRLEHRYLIAERATERLHLLPTFVPEERGPERGALVPNPEATRLDGGRGTRGRGSTGRERDRGRGTLRTPGRVETVELLAAGRMLPAIDFVFSRAGCDQAVEQCLGAGLNLTEPGERAEIRAIVERKTAALTDEDLDVLNYGRWLAGVEAGFAAHHAGMVPPMKEAVEEAFATGLVKVVFATETLALGINMPARTVVIEKLSKFTGERHEFLTPGEYTQLTGRAGRRGIDDLGYAVVCWSPFVPFDQVASLASRRTDALRSSFRPTYNMAANLVRRYEAAEAHHLLNLSFAQFHADRDVVALERQLGRNAETLTRARAAAHSDFGDIEDYRRLQGQLDGARREHGSQRKVEAALRALKPGDVILYRRRGGRLAILAHDRGRADTRLLALSASRGLVRLGVDDFDAPPQPVAHIELPQPHAPKSASFRKQTAERLRRVKLRDTEARSGRDNQREAELAEALAAHPVARDPDLTTKLKAAAAVERLERDVTRSERRVRGRSESLARQFDRVLRVLESWGYVDGWSLTDAGQRLARLYTETDLLLATAIGDGLLDGLRAPELAAVVSCFTYERRGPEGPGTLPPPRWPSKTVALRVRAIERIARDLNHNEDDAGLPETRGPDPGFTLHIAEWVGGDPLADVLDDDEMTGGDFVRNVKQCIDLLGQVATVAPDERTRETAREAAAGCNRGVVAASSVAAVNRLGP